MQPYDEAASLVRNIEDGSRKVAKASGKYLVPLKFDDNGTPLSAETFDPAKHLKRLSLDDLRFLHEWRAKDWDHIAVCKSLDIDLAKAEKLVKRLQAFREEDAFTKALAEVPSPSWIAAKHVENVFGNKLEDSQRDSLKELAKITGAYKPTTNVNINANVLQMPELTPEQAKKAREFFDTIADEGKAA